MEPRSEKSKDIKARPDAPKDRFRIVKLEERIAPAQLLHLGPVHVKIKL